MNWDVVKESTVAITTQSGDVVGTGFFISRYGHLLTCAHVVEQTGKQPYIQQKAPQQVPQSAEIIYQGDPEADDFAILRVSDYRGESVSIGFNFNPGDRFLSIGYGRSDFGAATIEGSITDENSQASFAHLPMLRLLAPGDAQRFEGGYSGAPVFNDRSKQVIGMVAARDHDNGGLAVPLHTVQGRWAELIKLCLGLEYPEESSVPLESHFYIERYSRDASQHKVELYCYKAIQKPYALLLITAPRLMGKTSLMSRILNYVEKQCAYKTVYINLRDLYLTSNSNSDDEFIKRFCQEVTEGLGIEDRLNSYWKNDLIPVDNCFNYFKNYVFSNTQGQLVLGLDSVDEIFPDESLSRRFFSMLRNWHERGKQPANRATWYRLKIVMTYSTEVYIQLGEQSPFNVGQPISLPELTKQQVEELANRHGLHWDETQLEALITMVGGHPHLLRLAMYEISERETTLQQLLQDAATNGGIYSAYLLNLWNSIRRSKLEEISRKVVISDSVTSEQLDPLQSKQLKGLGLIKEKGDKVVPACKLYQLYFSKNLIANKVTSSFPLTRLETQQGYFREE